MPTQPGQARGRKPRFTRAQVIDTAIELIAVAGVRGFNMRSLAADLGLSPMGLYRYFPDKDELLDAMVARALEPVASGPAGPGPWQRRLERAMREMFDLLVANPGLAELSASRFPGPQLDEFRARLYVTLAGAGLGPERERDVLRALTSYVLGFAIVVPARASGPPGRAEAESFEFGLGLLMESLADDRSAAR